VEYLSFSIEHPSSLEPPAPSTQHPSSLQPPAPSTQHPSSLEPPAPQHPRSLEPPRQPSTRALWSRPHLQHSTPAVLSLPHPWCAATSRVEATGERDQEKERTLRAKRRRCVVRLAARSADLVHADGRSKLLKRKGGATDEEAKAPKHGRRRSQRRSGEGASSASQLRPRLRPDLAYGAAELLKQPGGASAS
jgi:hypothetical protein